MLIWYLIFQNYGTIPTRFLYDFPDQKYSYQKRGWSSTQIHYNPHDRNLKLVYRFNPMEAMVDRIIPDQVYGKSKKMNPIPNHLSLQQKAAFHQCLYSPISCYRWYSLEPLELWIPGPGGLLTPPIFGIEQKKVLFRGHSATTWTEFCHCLTPPPPSSCPRSYWMDANTLNDLLLILALKLFALPPHTYVFQMGKKKFR